jgi:hypothetical protein
MKRKKILPSDQVPLAEWCFTISIKLSGLLPILEIEESKRSQQEESEERSSSKKLRNFMA